MVILHMLYATSSWFWLVWSCPWVQVCTLDGVLVFAASRRLTVAIRIWSLCLLCLFFGVLGTCLKSLLTPSKPLAVLLALHHFFSALLLKLYSFMLFRLWQSLELESTEPGAALFGPRLSCNYNLRSFGQTSQHFWALVSYFSFSFSPANVNNSRISSKVYI